MQQRFKGKNVLVTGASSGIGEAVAIRLAQEGANVAINYNSGEERAEAVRAKADAASKSAGIANPKHLIVKGNVADEGDVKKMFATVLDELGSLEVLINNSGIQKPAA